MSVTYSCDPGHYLVGNAVVFCRASGNWSQPGPRCEEVTCPQPPNIANGLHSGQTLDKFSWGATVYYSCKDGYELVGNVSIKCTESGAWSGPRPRCKAIGCKTPEVQNGKVYNPQDTYKAGETLQFDCDAGYTTQDSYESRCQPGGTWDPPVLICGRVRPCPMPPRVPSGNHNGQGNAFFTTGMSVTYSCDPGHYLVGNAVVFCRASGNWSQPGPRCEGRKCSHPGEPVNGKISSLTDLHFGSTVHYSCEEGHRLIGQASLQCEISGGHVAWSGDVPTCQRIPCEPPPDIPNGKHTGRLLDEFVFGTSVAYTCDRGYRGSPLHGEPSIHCTTRDGQNGVWSGPPPRCGGRAVQARCPIPQVQNGRIVSPRTAYTHKDTAAFECDPGYVLRGHSVVQCQLNSTWEPPVPVCEQAGCTAPTRLAFAGLKEPNSNQSIFPVGSTVEYVCRPGYTQHPGMPTTITCLGNKTWSVALEFCKRKQCANPGDVENGRAVVLTDLLFGSKVNYTCDEGYKLVGGSQRTCEVSGTSVSWSGDAPVCQRITCDPPLDIPHGRHSGRSTDTFSYADVVTYTCEPGYPLHGEPSIFCTTADGEHGGAGCRRAAEVGVCGVWASVPSGDEVQCPPPPSIANAEHSGQPSDTHLPGSAVQYSCRDGYSLVGNTSITCTAAGTWSRPRPRCEAIGCTRPEIENGGTTGLETVYRLTDIVVFECNFGYALKGSQESQCQFGGTWDPPVPTCEKMLQCPSPPNIKNGQHESKDVKEFIPGMSVKYHCDPGYVLTGKTAVSCLTSGTWSIPYPRCEVITCTSPDIHNGDVAEGQQAVYHPGANVTFQCQVLPCPPPPVIAHATHSAELRVNFTTGMSVTYSCQPGFSLLGDPSVSCTASGNWSLPYPRCTAGCGTPTTLLFAELNKEYKNQTEFPVGKTVKYTCRPGYMKHPQISPTLTCLENQTWSEAQEFCKRKKCDHPGEPENGRLIVITDLFFGSTVNYTCDEGADAKATLYVPTESQCSRPPAIANGSHSGPDTVVFTSGMSVSYACDPGYVLVGEAELNCTSSGAWSVPAPRCEGRLCPSLPAIDHGQHDGEDVKEFIPGRSVNYSCDPGYSLIGKPTLYCTVNGTWSIPYPRCEDGCGAPPNLTFAELTEEYKNLTEFPVGDTVQYSCRPGYMRHPGVPPTLTCLKNHTWSEALAFCESTGWLDSLIGDARFSEQMLHGVVFFPSVREMSQVWGDAVKLLHCSKPAQIAHGSLHGPPKAFFTPGSSVNYICEPGFSLIGTGSIHCTQSGAWSHPPPVCQAVKCPHPPKITNGELKGNLSDTFSYGASVSYSCNSGYSLVGSAFINCTGSGTWSQPPPQCREIRCVFPEVQGVKKTIKGNTYSSGTNITLECDDGYTLEGTSQIQCQEDFSWDPPVPACKLTSHKSGSVTLGAAAAGVLLLLGAGIVWKIISKQKEGYYNTYENYSGQTPLNQITEQKHSCLP
ncbi:PREDICTED: complement receptor type 1-like [Pterocles gutturalis]|nr:PREDICTED: complement receptor type 1-like [Pterocles gutturalis]